MQKYPHKKRHFKMMNDELDCAILYSNPIWLPDAAKYMTEKDAPLYKAPTAATKFGAAIRSIYTQVTNAARTDVALPDRGAYYSYACLVARKYIVAKKINEEYCRSIAERLRIEYIPVKI
jgi:hypothetical protein